MIKLGKEGYYFISESGIKYDLYEGLTMGAEQRYTSDAIMIMLADERYYDKVNNYFVNYIMGASFLEEDIDEFDEDISNIVTIYEQENKIYKENQTMIYLPSGRKTDAVLMSILTELKDIYIVDHEVMTDESKIKLLENILDLTHIIDNTEVVKK